MKPHLTTLANKRHKAMATPRESMTAETNAAGVRGGGGKELCFTTIYLIKTASQTKQKQKYTHRHQNTHVTSKTYINHILNDYDIETQTRPPPPPPSLHQDFLSMTHMQHTPSIACVFPLATRTGSTIMLLMVLSGMGPSRQFPRVVSNHQEVCAGVVVRFERFFVERSSVRLL